MREFLENFFIALVCIITILVWLAFNVMPIVLALWSECVLWLFLYIIVIAFDYAVIKWVKTPDNQTEREE